MSVNLNCIGHFDTPNVVTVMTSWLANLGQDCEVQFLTSRIENVFVQSSIICIVQACD